MSRLLRFADALQPHPLPVELDALRIGNTRSLERHDDPVACARDPSPAEVFEAVAESELYSALHGDFSCACGFRSAAVSVIVAGAERDRDGFPALFQAHLKYSLAV